METRFFPENIFWEYTRYIPGISMGRVYTWYIPGIYQEKLSGDSRCIGSNGSNIK
jgi:hypothetical protein